MAEAFAQERAPTPSLLYDRGVAAQRWQDDPEQRGVLQHLDRIHAQLIAAETAELNARWWNAWRRDVADTRGLYLWGAVGRGKTFLIDLLFQSLPFERKLRLHFHRFMGRVHAQLARLEGQADPLRDVAAHFADQARVFCLDEFFVTDIGDAMILAGLLQHLFERGVTLVTTSNIEPSNLYRDGLQRAKFLPAIALLEQHCEVVQLLAPHDYRLRALTQAGIYFSPLGADAERGLDACFERLAPGLRRPEAEIQIHGRAIAVKRRADGVIWFDFAAICDGPRSQDDYIELSRLYQTVLVSNVPRFDALLENQARRFIALVDEFYDRRVKLILSAAARVVELYSGEKLRQDFERTRSRLIEMQTHDYLASPHRP